MDKILLIDRGVSSIHQFKKALLKKDLSLLTTKSISKALPVIKKGSIALIAIDNALLSRSYGIERLKKAAANIPKTILLYEEDRSSKLWLRQKPSLPVNEPVTFREFWTIASQLLKISSIEPEKMRMRSELERRSNELDFFNSSADTLTASPDLQKCLTSTMEKAKKACCAKTWSVLLSKRDPAFDFVTFRQSKKIRKVGFKVTEGIAGYVMESGRPLIIGNVKKDRRFNKSVDQSGNQTIKSMICVPLVIKDRVAGVIRLINKKDGLSFSEDDLNILMKAAGFIGMMIDHTYLNIRINNDDLTNLYNVRYLHRALEMELTRAARYNFDLSVIFMDLDDFKKINDRFGHLIGSRMLIEIAKLLQYSLRKIDIITRYGGDEFVILLLQTDQEGAFQLAERLRKTIEKRVFLQDEDYSIRLTASFGIASFPVNAKSKEDLLRIADKAMYHGKFSTKNIVYLAE